VENILLSLIVALLFIQVAGKERDLWDVLVLAVMVLGVGVVVVYVAYLITALFGM
jgi:hypothetical protein